MIAICHREGRNLNRYSGDDETVYGIFEETICVNIEDAISWFTKIILNQCYSIYIHFDQIDYLQDYSASQLKDKLYDIENVHLPDNLLLISARSLQDYLYKGMPHTIYQDYNIYDTIREAVDLKVNTEVEKFTNKINLLIDKYNEDGKKRKLEKELEEAKRILEQHNYTVSQILTDKPE